MFQIRFIYFIFLIFLLFDVSYADNFNSKLNELVELNEISYIDLDLKYTGDVLDTSKNILNITILHENLYDLEGRNLNILQYESGVSGNHSDLYERIIYKDNFEIKDHATHVSGIIIGNGNLNSNFTGIAPLSSIYSYEENCLPLGCDYDLESNFEDGISDDNVSLISVSWGNLDCDEMGKYQSRNEFLDNLILGNSVDKKVPIIWAVGNKKSCNSSTGFYTIISEASSKNVISVGNVYDTFKLRESSGIGPVDDGRIKPDLVAIGTNIFSTISNDYIDLYDNTYWFEGSDGLDDFSYPYDNMSGTSMAAPHVSGTIALMLEQWNRQYTTDPLPSTIKALLLDSTTDLHRNGNGTQIIDGPDYKNGYGLLNAKEAVDRIINQTFIEDNISDDQVKVYAININNQNELKVTLAWDDLPGNPALSSEGVLVNDLNLKLISPNGITFYPWVLDPSNSSAKAEKGEDHKNNVEQVYINNPINGEWLVLIDENNIDVSVNEQKFSLVSKNQIKPYNFQTEEKIITLNTENYWKNLNWKFDKTNYYATINSGSLLNNYLYYDEPLLKFQDTIFIKASSGSITVHHFLFGLEFNQTQNIDTWKNNYGHYMRYAIQFDPNTDKIRVSEFNNPQTGTTQFTAFPDVIFIPNQEYDFKIEVDSVKGAKYYYKISINPILIDDINWSLLYDSTSSGNNNGVLRGTDSLKFWASGRNIDSSNQINYIKFEANS